MDGFFTQALVYLAAAVVAVPLAQRAGLGSVLGYLVAGVAIGPFGLELVGEEGQDVLHFAEFGVVMMLFVIGLELKPAMLWRLRGPILGLGGAQVAATALALLGVGVLLGLGWRPALAVGLTLALSSTAIVLQSLEEKGLTRTAAGQSAFGVLLFQDIAVIPILALLPLLATAAPVGREQGHGSWADTLPAWGRTAALFGALAGIVLVGLYVVRPALRLVARTRMRELFTAASLLLVVGVAALTASVGLSPALGTFLAGVLLANSEFRHELESDVEPFKGLLLGLFFIAVGAGIDFGLVGGMPGTIAGLVGALVVAKLAVLYALGRAFRLSLDQRVLFAFALAQGGEFAFVLLSFAVQNGVVEGELAATLVAVVALSMVATPLLLLAAERLVLPRVGTKERAPRPADEVHGEAPVIVAGFGRFGHIVGRFLLANGVGVTVLDSDSDQVDMLRKLGLEVFYGDASRADLLRAAGAEKARLLVVAVDEPRKVDEIVATARRHFPELRILARARGRQHAYELLDAGVEHVYRETLDSSLRLGSEALRLLGMGAHPARRAAAVFRRHDEASLRELAALRHDQKAYFGRARQGIRDLERLVRADRDGRLESVDAAWDASSLRAEAAGAAAPERDGAGGGLPRGG